MVSNKIVFLMYPLTTLINFYLINIACQNFNQILSLFPLIPIKSTLSLSLSSFIYYFEKEILWFFSPMVIYKKKKIQAHFPEGEL